MPEFLIEIREQEILLTIGLHDFEKSAPQRVLVTVQLLTTNVTGAASDFVDYDVIANHIRSLNGATLATQEDLIQGIHTFALTLPKVAQARVTSCKPDVYPDCAWVGVSYPARPLFG